MATLRKRFLTSTLSLTRKSLKEKLAASDDRFPTATYGHALQAALGERCSDFIVREIKAFMGGKKDPLSVIPDVKGSNGAGKANEARRKKVALHSLMRKLEKC